MKFVPKLGAIEISIALLALLGTGIDAKAQLAVAVAVDSPFTMANWTQQIAQATATVTQATDIARKTQTILQFAGDPSAAIRNLADVSGILTSVGRMTDTSKTAGALASGVDAASALNSSANQFRSRVGDAITTFGTTTKRDVSLYEATMSLEGVVNGARKMSEDNHANLKQLHEKLAVANQRLANAQTESEIAAAQADIQRVGTLMQGTALVNQNLINEATLMKEQKEIADNDAILRRQEELAAEGRALADRAELQHKHFSENVGAQLKDGKRAAWDTSEMFDRKMLPPGP